MRHKSSKLNANIHKIFCGTVIALALVVLPLPALADDQPAIAPADTAATAPAESPATTATTPDNTTSDVSLATPSDENRPTLQSAPASNGTGTPNLSLQQAGQPVAVPSDPAPDTAVNVENGVDSEATSGNASVTGNETAGDATTGDATATATVVNVANASGVVAGNFQTLECDIIGDIQGNVFIDPASLEQITGTGAECRSTAAGASSNPSPAGTSAAGLQNGSNLVNILNDIVLSAASGNANVENNGQAGDATTGDAAALANVVNIANTAIGAQNSFLGVINIHGNLTGDILVPQSFVDSLVDGGGGSGSVGNTTILNNLMAGAVSGNATVAGNETAGNATSGEAATSLTVMNLTGQEVVAKNSLLVFVNVMGEWIGMIVPAPGSNTAMLGGDVRSGAGQQGSAGAGGDVTTDITNNISVQAQSGDATVAGNETAGDATSGNAAAGVNLLNITDSNFLLDDWFGALFINVLGSWLGNFDIRSDAPATPGVPPVSRPIQAVQVFQFTGPVAIPASAPAQTPPATAGSAATPEVKTPEPVAGTVLGSSVTDDQDSAAANGTRLNLVTLAAMVVALTMLIALGTLAVRRRFATD